MTFEELAHDLYWEYTQDDADRPKWLREFGCRWATDLMASQRQGRSLEELLDAAGLCDTCDWAKEIRAGIFKAIFLGRCR